MVKKILLAAAASSALFALAAMGNGNTLTLENASKIPTIKVTCNGKVGIPLTQNNPISLQWVLLFFTYQSKSFDCQFSKSSEGEIGSAHVTINADNTQGELSNIKMDPQANLNVTFLQGSPNVMASNISVSIIDDTK